MSEVPPPQPQQPYPPQPGVRGGERPAELLDRFLARLIDFVILAVVNGIIVSVIVIGAIMGDSGGLMWSTGSSFLVGAVTAVLGAAIHLGYFSFMESSQGQTVGKMVLKLHTYGPGGQKPTFEEALKRNIWAGFGIAGIIPIVGGLIGGVAELVAVIMIAVGINNDTVNRQAWHDQFAGGTYVRKQG
jgi:uncharacterized RDD family membrane protein YckC